MNLRKASVGHNSHQLPESYKPLLHSTLYQDLEKTIEAGHAILLKNGTVAFGFDIEKYPHCECLIRYFDTESSFWSWVREEKQAFFYH
ncbi:hypothetical protein ACPV5O_26475 [Vibrio maritimus]|jgi:TPP-dependent 2-oxoacid decarboxylase|uniref:hypothetical protein n=1 Tax=Vibrio maritimus TaxID=990268 RepID=UPI0040690C5D